MDFWTRLIGGTGGQKRRSTAHDPQQRLARFKRVYNQILQTWQKSSSLASDPAALDTLRSCFQRLTGILNEESRSPAPHLCLSFAASSQIFSAVSRIAATSHNEALVREAVAVFSALIDSEEEEFLANERFAEALMTFISKIASSNSLIVGEDTDAEIVELLFGIAAKIRLEPGILPVWFSSRGTVDSDGSQSVQKVGFAGVIRKGDFPLCYQLVDHVHHEGRIGDFARTGLLYIFETASKSADLEQWIVESDLATLMASGLGALYSQLSRKLSIIHPHDDLPIILQLSDYPEMNTRNEAESVFSPDFRVHMDTFLSYLAFWQDVLEHCRSPDVRQTLIDHFQVLFLQQLLYPSLLESSDIDGGSSVAVLTYLRRILDALDHPELVHMILRYLLALPDEYANRPRSPGVRKRRSTLMLLAQPNDEDDAEQMSPDLFNLVDLLLNSTQSRNSQTVVSALKLVTTILSKNHKYATGTLVSVTDVHIKDPQRTIGALNAEIESYLEIAEDLVPGAELNKTYEAFLKDALSLLESHPCSMKMLALNGLNLPNQAAVEYLTVEARKDEPLHHLTAGDALFKSLMRILSNFFSNDVETNLNLTEAIVHLASCPNLRLEGWLAVEPARYQFSSSETFEEEDESLRDLYRARRKPTWPSQETPALLAALRILHEQIECLRHEIPDFDQHVANRKQAFRVHEEIYEAMQSTANFPPPSPLPVPRSSIDTPAGSWTPLIPHHVFEGTISPLRSQSPRGRALSAIPPPAPNSRLELRPATARASNGTSPSRSRAVSPFKDLSRAISQFQDDPRSVSPFKDLSRAISQFQDPPRAVSPFKDLSQAIGPADFDRLRQPSITTTVLNDVNDAANAEILKRVIRFPLTPKAALRPQPEEIQNEVRAIGAVVTEEADAKKPENGDDVTAGAEAGDTQVNGMKTNDAEAGDTEPGGVEINGSKPETGDRVVEVKQEETDEGEGPREASLGHVLTNVIILQEFVLELIAIVQTRASLFQEVRFV